MQKNIGNKRIQGNRGVTFIELIVVMAIFGIMSGVVLFRYRDFDAGISLTNTVQEIALRIQKAQSDSVNGVQPKLASINQLPPADDWRNTYGVVFSVDQSDKFIYFFNRETRTSAPQAQIKLDDPNPWAGSCGNGNEDECLDLITITTGEKITNVCVETDATMVCNLREAWVAFSRPFPDAKIYYTASDGTVVSGKALKITLEGKNDAVGTRVLTVTPLGQLSVTR